MALLASTPLAAWLSLGALRPATAQPPPAAAASASVAVTAAPEAPARLAAPSDYCVSRLLSPIEAMSGRLAPEPPAAADALSVTGSLREGQVQLDVARAPASHPPAWLERVDRALDGLTQAFGTPGRPATIISVIATIPDPIDSGLTYQFESALQSLRRGVEFELAATSSGTQARQAYYRDRSFLPWEDREVDTARQKESADCRASVPGIMLFRGGNPEQGRLFALLLVGESPTTGLRRSAMQSALAVQARLDAHAPSAERTNPRSVKLVGPCYSASAQSLRLALESFAGDQTLRYSVVSGTASGSKVPLWLKDSGGPASITYEATTVPEGTLECAYLRFLEHRLGAVVSAEKTLTDVATLTEAGTEFGATTGDTCPVHAGLGFHFPFHVSALRDAYEDQDQRENATQKEASLGHATSLEPSLREGRVPLDVEANPSDKTRAAEDTALVGVLEHISTSHVRQLAIRATDVGDAIFLARRIHDVAPDIRLAFFTADALLLNAAYRRELLGSLVVSPYPFFGLSEFTTQGMRAHDFAGFESSNAQGLFNAMLAQREASPATLSEYMVGSGAPLPVWIAAVGRGQLVPLKLSTTANCEGTVHGAYPPSKDGELARYCDAKKRGVTDDVLHEARRTFTRKYAASLRVDPARHLPHIWDFVFTLIAFAFFLDRALQNRRSRGFTTARMPAKLQRSGDLLVERVIARTKWRFYAAIRALLFVVALGYMTTVYGLSLIARGGPDRGAWSLVTFAFGASAAIFVVAAAGRGLCLSAARFWRDYSDFARAVEASRFPLSRKDLADSLRRGQAPGPDAANGTPLPPKRQKRWLDRLSMRVGVAQPVGRNDMVRTSFAQIRMLCSLALVVTTVFAIALGWDISIAAGRFDHDGLRATPSLTLMVLRCAQLTSGVSPAAPALLCIACIYAWCVGRMARLGLAHAAAVAAPSDGESDLASTPIRLVLHPDYSAGTGSDLGFTAVERDLVNTIWRPITGPYYPIATLVLGFFPIVLFTLKPFSTLESFPGTLFVGGGLALGAFLAGVTLIQLVQYWLALQRVLKRALEHPIGAAFRTVPAFARDSVDHQVSRTPDEGLRWSACALEFQNLMRVANALPEERILEPRRTALAHASAELGLLRDGALSASDESVESAAAAGGTTAAELEALGADALVRPGDRLARGVIRAAASVMSVLQAAWAEDGAPRSAAEPLEHEAERVAEKSDIQAAVAHVAGFDLPAQGATALRTDESTPPPRRRSRIDSGKVVVPTARRERAVQDNPRLASAKGDDGGAPSARHEDALTPVEASFDAAELRWLRAAQTFVATVVTLLIYRHVRQFRYFLWVTTSSTLLLLLALVSYPFEPYRLLLTYAWVVTGSVVGVCLWVFISMDRNTLMSHIAGTSPDHVTFNTAFWLRVFAWGVVPLLSVAAAQYPGVANFLFGILSPFTRALR